MNGRVPDTETGAVEAFAAAWDSARRTLAAPPDLASYLPDAATLRRQTLIDLIRVDLQYRWLHGGSGRSLDEYCREFPWLDRAALPPNLIYEEFVIRRQAGDHVEPADYLRDYPGQAGRLRLFLYDGSPGDLTVPSRVPTVAPEITDRTAPADHTAPRPRTEPSDRTAPGARTDTTLFGDSTEPESPVLVATSLDALEAIGAGQRIDDFDLLTPLGSGAFARVYLARQLSMQRLVAVKISTDHSSESQTLAQLDHDYIVRVFDQRLLPDSQLKLLYMQYLPGGTLHAVLRHVRETPAAERTGQLLLTAVDAAMEAKGEIRPAESSLRTDIARLSWPETVAWIGRRLADALDYADRRGVLHRDIKPANILLTADGVPKLADFNISYSASLSDDNPVAYFGGSLAYMSPEHLAACHPDEPGAPADLDTRSDIYSLGVLTWELLAGSKPFVDSDTDAGDHTLFEELLATRRRGLDTDAFASLPADCPAALRRVLTRCLASDPAERWSNGHELAKQFDLCLDPQARDLVDPPPISWRRRLRPWAIVLLTLAVVVPNALAAIYNIRHNKLLIIDGLTPQAQSSWLIITATVNAIFWPIGAMVNFYRSRHVLAVPYRIARNHRYDPAMLARVRHDALLAGDWTVAVTFALWLAAGITFPVSLQLAAGSIPMDAMLHVAIFMTICGAIGVGYPFFLINVYIVRSIYPSLVLYGALGADDARQLRALRSRAGAYLAIAASIPLLAVASITFLPVEDIPATIGDVRALSLGGVLGFVITWWLFRILQTDLQALERVATG